MMNMAMLCSLKPTISVRVTVADMGAGIVRLNTNRYPNPDVQNYSFKNKKLLSQKRKLPV